MKLISEEAVLPEILPTLIGLKLTVEKTKTTEV